MNVVTPVRNFFKIFIGSNHSRADLKVLIDSLGKCKRPDDSLSTDHYLCAGNELIRLFHQLGGGLGSALHEVDDAIKTLEIRRVSGAQCHYDALDLMVHFEMKNNLINDHSNGQSGTKALMLLHDAMDFMLVFLKKMREAIIRDCPFSGSERIQIYLDTIGKRHSPIIQATVKMMLMRSPSRVEMMANFQSSIRGDQSALDAMACVIAALDPVVKVIDDLMEQLRLDSQIK